MQNLLNILNYINNIMLTLTLLDNTIKDIFNDKLVKSVDTVYEKKGDGYMLVISIHGLELQDTIIIHTKFIFPVNKDKTGLSNNKFSYLTSLGCDYKYVEYESDNVDDLKGKINNIIDNNDFDDDLKDLSEFLSDSPSSRINSFLNQRKIDHLSVFNIIYEPKFKMSSCEDTTFDFKVNVNNTDDVIVSIHKNEPRSKSTYTVTYKFTEIHTEEIDSMANIGEVIGLRLIELFK
jgi:hypothetical protein